MLPISQFNNGIYYAVWVRLKIAYLLEYSNKVPNFVVG